MNFVGRIRDYAQPDAPAGEKPEATYMEASPELQRVRKATVDKSPLHSLRQ